MKHGLAVVLSFVALVSLGSGCLGGPATDGEDAVGVEESPLMCDPGPFGRCIDPCATVTPQCPPGRTLVVDAAAGSQDLCRCNAGPFGGCLYTWVAPSCPAGYPDLIVQGGPDQCASPDCGTR